MKLSMIAFVTLAGVAAPASLAGTNEFFQTYRLVEGALLTVQPCNNCGCDGGQDGPRDLPIGGRFVLERLPLGAPFEGFKVLNASWFGSRAGAEFSVRPDPAVSRYFRLSGDVGAGQWGSLVPVINGVRGPTISADSIISVAAPSIEAVFVGVDRTTCTQYVIELAAEPACVSDFDNGSGKGVPDGGVGVEDLLYYLALFTRGEVFADVDDGTGRGFLDGGVGIEDLLFFLQRFEAGC